MKVRTTERSRKHTSTEVKWAMLMAKAVGDKLKRKVYLILYTDPEAFPTVEFRLDPYAVGKFYHAGYLGDMADPQVRKLRASLILKDIVKTHENNS